MNKLSYAGQMHPLNMNLDWQRFKRMIWISDDARSMGIHIMAGKGSGKSRLMGRLIGWLDFIRGVPQVIFDPHGPTIDNFMDKLLYMPPDIQRKLWTRVLYVDMSGKDGFVVPFPLFYRLGDESHYEIAQRYLDVVRKIDPFLQTASIEGWNALWKVGTSVGMVLSALNLQIQDAENLINYPQRYADLIHSSENIYGYREVIFALEKLLQLSKEKDNVRSRKIESYINKISLFKLDPAMSAMFGGNLPGVDWKDVQNRRLTVLLDFRHEHDVERRRFKMVWAFNYLLEYIKHRGAGRHQPIGLIIDELTSLFSLQALAGDLLGSEMDELINVLARNYRLWLTIAHQEMFQISERTFKSLMTMGTQILGVATDPAASKYLAELMMDYDPYKLKKVENVWGSVDGEPVPVDYRTVEYTPEEQILLNSIVFRKQKLFEFMVRAAPQEGNIQSRLIPFHIKNIDEGIFPNQTLLQLARELLMKQYAQPIKKILLGIEKGQRVRQIPSHLSSLEHQKKRPINKDISIWD